MCVHCGFNTDSEEVNLLQSLIIMTISYAHTCLYQNRAYLELIYNLLRNGFNKLVGMRNVKLIDALFFKILVLLILT